MNTDSTTPRKPVRLKTKPQEIPPDVNTLQDLIDMAQSGKKYANINNEMLWKITAQLIDINEMVGMEKLKKSIFYHVIFYLLDLFTEHEHDYLHTVIMGPPGSGKCLGKDTLVKLYDGSCKKVQDIVIGDQLLGDDHTPRNVLSTCKGTSPLYTIKPSYSTLKHDQYVVNDRHILSLVDTDTGAIVDMCISDYNTYIQQHSSSRYKGFRVPCTFRPETQPDIDPYVLGFTIACIYSGRTIYPEHLVFLPNKVLLYFIEHNYVLQDTDQDIFVYYDNCHPLVLNDEYTHLLFEQKRLPERWNYYSQQSILGILTGIFDCIGKQSQNRVEMFIENEYLFTQIQMMCNILGLDYSCSSTTYSVTDEYIDTRVASYNVSIPWVLEGSLILESEDTWSVSNDRVEYDIDIKPTAEGEYYGFELDGNGRFVLDNFSVTHNTTIAKIIGEMYKNMGILSPDGVFKIAKREDFIAEYLGQTAIKTKKLLESCLGGVLFIDEVYALGPGTKDNDSFSKEAIDTINVFLSEHSDSFCCIIAGYEEDIKQCFFSVNKGLERRFQWVHHIETYSEEDLASIFCKLLAEFRWKRDPRLTHGVLTKHIKANKHLFKCSGGDIENLITKCKMAHAKRIINQIDPGKHIITEEDVVLAIELMQKNKIDKQEQDDIAFIMYV